MIFTFTEWIVIYAIFANILYSSKEHNLNCIPAKQRHFRYPTELLCFKIWAKPGLLFYIFRSFHNAMTNIAQIWLYMHMWCAWDSNLGRQNVRRRRIHWAMTAPHRVIVNCSTIENIFETSFRRSLSSRLHQVREPASQLQAEELTEDQQRFRSVLNLCLAGKSLELISM